MKDAEKPEADLKARSKTCLHIATLE